MIGPIFTFEWKPAAEGVSQGVNVRGGQVSEDSDLFDGCSGLDFPEAPLNQAAVPRGGVHNAGAAFAKADLPLLPAPIKGLQRVGLNKGDVVHDVKEVILRSGHSLYFR